MTCPVCVDKYNKTIKAEIKCYFDDCAHSSCKECVRTYLIGTIHEPHCMKCRKKWDLEFTKNSLNASFMQKEYKAHRQTILVDRTISQIQEHYEAAIQLSNRRKQEAAIKVVTDEIQELNDQINEKYRKIGTIKNGIPNTNSASAATVQRKFIMPCQTGGCRGMLSSAYKCDLCEKFTCSKCLESIAGEKNDHVCDPATIETAEEIKKNTRPCPNCGCRISKIDGCDQMWCIECKTAFSWSKGTIEVDMIHNPHYFQWMRQNGGVPRTDIPGAGCNENRLTTQIIFIRDVFNMLSKAAIFETEFLQNCKASGYTRDEMPLITAEIFNIVTETKMNIELEKCKKKISHDFFTNFHRFIIHTERIILSQLIDSIRDRDRNNVQIHYYILGEETREELSEYLVKRDNANARDGAHRDIVEAMVMVGKQIITELYDELIKIKVDFSWGLINDQLHILNRFGRGRDSADYIKTKMVDFAKFYKLFYLDNKAEIENTYRLYSEISQKYMKAVNKYSAYSNSESIKFLMIYNSKKQLYMWDSEIENARDHKFPDKESMMSQMKYYKDEEAKYV
jgi:hypothetical protein